MTRQVKWVEMNLCWDITWWISYIFNMAKVSKYWCTAGVRRHEERVEKYRTVCVFLTVWSSGRQWGSTARGWESLHKHAGMVWTWMGGPANAVNYTMLFHQCHFWIVHFDWLTHYSPRSVHSFSIFNWHSHIMVIFTCMETCHGQEWGLASTPFTTLVMEVVGVTVGFPHTLGQPVCVNNFTITHDYSVQNFVCTVHIGISTVGKQSH